MHPKIVGIVNITTDSFSDGGQFVDSDKAIAHGEELLQQGADWLDLGAESSNPDGERVSAAEEITRLTPVIRALKSAQLAIDTYKPEVMAHCLGLGAGMINDITALENPESVEVVKSFQVPVVLMFARNQEPRAEKQLGNPETILAEIEAFFGHRIEKLLKSGLREAQIILDPGMGFFLGSNPEPSLRVLQGLERLKKLGRPLYICVSRKSFIGSVLGGRPPHERQHGTLAAEIWAALQGVDYLRTHAVAPLRDALQVLRAIQM
jgi:dihydropteroate synthase type 2